MTQDRETLELCYRQIGLRIEQMRTALGWTQLELSKKVGQSRSAIANIENGKQRILLHHVDVFAAAFNVAPKHLIKGIWL